MLAKGWLRSEKENSAPLEPSGERLLNAHPFRGGRNPGSPALDRPVGEAILRIPLSDGATNSVAPGGARCDQRAGCAGHIDCS
jgi:hypothetical protein